MLDLFDEWLRSYFHGFKTVKNDSSSNVVIFNCLIYLYDVLIALMSRLAPLKPYFSILRIVCKIDITDEWDQWILTLVILCNIFSIIVIFITIFIISFFCKDGIIKTKHIIIITVVSINKINTKRLWWSCHCLLKWIWFTPTSIILNFKQNSFNINIKLVW